MTTMFTSIVVALDLGSVGDRALPFTASLATLGGLPVELITISSPGMPTAVDLYELERRAKGYGLEHFSCHVLHDDDSGAAIVAHMASRPDALLVMGSSAKGPVAGHLLGSVSEYVLGHIGSSVLVVGPRTSSRRLTSPTLVAIAGEADSGDVAAQTIAAWVATFGGQVVNATVASLEEVAGGVADPVYLAISARWADARFHLHSETRDLVRRATTPVLVVPARILHHTA